MNNDIYKNLFILEIANNHCGDMNHGKEIIRQFAQIVKNKPFKFAIKFQRRDLDTFIHPDYQNRLDIKYIKRFKETQLTVEQLAELQQYAINCGFLTICTAFDEMSVDVVQKLKFDYIKIASCSFNDWPLLNKVADTKLPVIASTGGFSLPVHMVNVERVVTFFDNRNIPLALMHCIGLYPTSEDDLYLNNIDILHNKFPNIPIGFSTHELPDNFEAIKIAVAKGATIFEKHVDISCDSKNTYSITPEDYTTYLDMVVQTNKMCLYNSNLIQSQQEQTNLRQLQRAVYAKTNILLGERFTKDNCFFSMPVQNDSHLTANLCSKYITFEAKKNIKINEPIFKEDVDIIDNLPTINNIKKETKQLLDKNYVVYPPKCMMDISHHYGLENFYTYGMCLITLINSSYCKKLLILLPQQINPTHYHKTKEETFFVLSGQVLIIVDNIQHLLQKGDMIHIKPNEQHSLQACNDEGVVIEELSSTHIANDSIYVDDNINHNLRRKTIVYV